MYECDNKRECHDPITIAEDDNALRVYCKICYHQYIIRKDENKNPEKRSYARIFKRDILQPSENLFYKVYPNRMNVI